MKALVGAFNQEKALVGAISVIVKTGCETDGSFYSTSYYDGSQADNWFRAWPWHWPRTGELRAVNYSRHWPASGAGQSPATVWAVENIPHSTPELQQTSG